ncbi:MAG: lecithin retinol acyltransferase family protein [Solirubrobacterales bacterium]
MTASTLTRVSPNRPRHQPARGAHIYVERDLYSHHGIDCGDGTVIDFAGQGGGKNTACIRRVTLAEFAQGASVKTRTYGSHYSPEVVVARAAAMIGHSGYDLFSNNCEHFATWCVTGEHSSAQVEAVWSAAGMVGVGNIRAAHWEGRRGRPGRDGPSERVERDVWAHKAGR